jgi:DNA repair protein RadC
MRLKILAIREPNGLSLLSPQHAANAMSVEAKADRECFWVLHLSSNHRVIDKELVAIGTINSTLIHPREVFKKAIVSSAVTIITVHNHPSGNLAPSPEDEVLWKRLDRAGKLIGIATLDHLIVGPAGGYYSQRENSGRSFRFGSKP